MKKEIANTPASAPSPGKLWNDHYDVILQNKATNQASHLTTRHNAHHLPMNQTSVSFKDVTALFTGKTLGVPETQLLDYIVAKHAQTSNHDNEPSVVFTLKEYMHDRGLKDSKSARASLKRGLDKLVSLQISYSGGDNKKKSFNPSFGRRNFFTGYDYKRGKAAITFTPEINMMLAKQAMPMPYPSLLYRLNPWKEATAWHILRRLSDNKWQNYGESRADRMKIKTILESCPSLPTYEEVMNGNRNVDDRIIGPFLKAVERLSEAFDYTFMDSKGQPFDYIKGVSYDEFIGASLVIKRWFDYPDNYARELANKRKRYRKKKK